MTRRRLVVKRDKLEDVIAWLIIVGLVLLLVGVFVKAFVWAWSGVLYA